MSSATMTERTTGYAGVSTPGYTTSPYPTPTGTTAGTNWMMVPRCTFKVEKCQGGFKITCCCDDKVAASMVQHLCSMLAGGTPTCCVMLNGMTVCTISPTMGLCKYECVENGVCVTCTSGDAACGAMLQSCCDCLSCLTTSGCTCCFMINNTPVCCGTSESCQTSPKGKSRV
ncbi:MAG: hypothetical protein IT429_22110 [Gemmataceae bacterium]|nr:hypothetical protein [Gemmataceae bacterium]